MTARADGGRASLPAAFEHAPIGLAIVDERGLVLAANAASCVLLDVPEDELVGSALWDRAHPDDVGAPERRYRRADGSVALVAERTNRIPGTEPPLYVVALHDVTESRRAAERVRTQTALAYSSELASVIAHEVRNAFAGIRGAVEIIGQVFPAGSEEREAIEHVRRRMSALEGSVDELLRFTRVRASQVGPVSIRSALGEVARSLALCAPEVELVVTGPDLLVQADRSLLVCGVETVCAHLACAPDRRGPMLPLEVEIAQAGELAELALHVGGWAAHELEEGLARPLFATRGGFAGLSIARRILEAQGAELRVEERGRDRAIVITLVCAKDLAAPHGAGLAEG